LRFLADHCISIFVVQTLRDSGHEVMRIRDVLPVESEDSVVIAKAQEVDAILLSLNGDFADIVAYPPSNFKGIVTLQMRNRPSLIRTLMDRFLAYVEQHPTQDHYRRKLIWVEPHRIRVRT